MNKIRIAINGANGRMGTAIQHLLQNDSEVDICALIGRSDPHYNYQDIDVIIDFSSEEGLKNVLQNAKCKIISGTTGISSETFHVMQEYGKNNGIIWGSNTSIGVNIMFAMVKKLSSIFGEEYDAEIYERHHRYKKDSPSGTALTIGKKIAEGRGVDFIKRNDGERQRGEIGFAVERGGNTVGYHETSFISDDERIWFGHEAFDRAIFAKGAIKLAKIAFRKNITGYHEASDILL